MRRRFENINTVAGGKIPVYACSISAPATAWQGPALILGCKYRSSGEDMKELSYVVDEINNSKVCRMDGKPINCTISTFSRFIQAYFNEGSVTGNIVFQFTIGDVFYYFFITIAKGAKLVPQLKLSPSTHLIHSIYEIRTTSDFMPMDTYIEL